MVDTRISEPTVGGLYVFTAAAGFGTLAIFGKLAILANLQTPTLLVFRFLIGSIIVWAVFGFRERAVRVRGRNLLSAIALGTVYGLMTGFFFTGLEFLSAGLAAILFYTYPLLVFVISTMFLGERISWVTLWALFSALAGVVLIIGGSTSVWNPVGVLFVLTASLGYAVYVTGSRFVLPSVDTASLTMVVLASATVVMVLFGLFSGGMTVPSGVEQWSLIVGIGVIGTAVPIVLFLKGLERIDPGHASIIGTAEPLVTVVLGVVLLGESATLHTLLGGVLVLSGVLVIQRVTKPTAMVTH